MISVDEALEYVLKHFKPLEPEEVEILDGLDRVLAEDVYSDIDIPPFDNSAMDGYAVRAADTVGASSEAPVTLRVIADLAAGYTTDLVVEPGVAIRIMTGAPLPAGADAVVRFEETSEGLQVKITNFHRVLCCSYFHYGFLSATHLLVSLDSHSSRWVNNPYFVAH